MTTQFSTVTGCAHNSHGIRERKNCLFSSCTKAGPVFYMIFRPEEMDATSSERPVFCPLTQRNIDIAMYAGRGLSFYDSIAQNNFHGLAAIQTRRIDLHCLSWKYPADRQGFKPSLCKPFLFSVHSKAVLRRLIVEWRK